MRINLKATLTLLALIFAVGAPGAEAAEYGSINVDGTEMKVEGAVAIWIEDTGRLSVTLLPFEPNDEEIALIRQGHEGRIEHELVAPKTWPHSNPRGSISLSWFDPEARGDFSKSNVHVYTYGVGAQNQNLNLSYMMSYVEDESIQGSLTGSMQPGGKVHMVSQGKDTLSESTISWDLDIQTTVLSRLPKE